MSKETITDKKKAFKELREEINHLHQRIDDLKELTLNLASVIGAMKDTNTLVMWPSLYEALPGLKQIVATRGQNIMEADAKLRKEAKDQENKEILEKTEKPVDSSNVI